LVDEFFAHPDLLAVLTVAARPEDEDHPFGHGKAEYFASGVDPVAGLAKAIYQPSTGALMVLDGNLLVTVQGVFIATGPIRQVDTLDHLIPLADIATKRA